MSNTEHSSRDGIEHPVAILSGEGLRIMSHPTSENLKSSLTSIDEAICCNTNRVGHLVVPKEEVEITPNFAGVKGNLSWFNSGDSPLLFRLETAQVSKSIILDPGFGLTLGMRERHTRVFLSTIATAKKLFDGAGMASKPCHAIFLDCGPTLDILNAQHPAKEYWSLIPSGGITENLSKPIQVLDRHNQKQLPSQKKEMSTNSEPKYEEICNSLGAVVVNRRKNWIRITPARGYKFEPGFFKKKLEGIKEWINAAIQGAPKARFPKLLDMVVELEKPSDGDPFEMVWVKFEDNENLWALKIMMLGVKIGRFAGFPKVLLGLEKKLYVSRDRRSEGERRVSLL